MSNVTPCAFLSIFLVRIPKKEICSIFGNRDDIGHKHKRGLWIINPSKLQQNQSRFQFITDSGRWLAAKYWSIAARRGKKKALVAISHRMLRIIYSMLINKEPYKEPLIN